MDKLQQQQSSISFFIKCSECKLKPATLKCFDCKRFFGESQNKFCYTCDSKLHQNSRDKNHKKEIIPYSEMYNQTRSDINLSTSSKQLSSKQTIFTTQQSSAIGQEKNQARFDLQKGNLLQNYKQQGKIYEPIDASYIPQRDIYKKDTPNLLQKVQNLESKFTDVFSGSNKKTEHFDQHNSSKNKISEIEKSSEILEQRKKLLIEKIEKLNQKMTPLKNNSSKMETQNSQNYEIQQQQQIYKQNLNKYNVDEIEQSLPKSSRNPSNNQIDNSQVQQLQNQYQQQQTQKYEKLQNNQPSTQSTVQLKNLQPTSTYYLKSNIKKLFNDNLSPTQKNQEYIKQKSNQQNSDSQLKNEYFFEKSNQQAQKQEQNEGSIQEFRLKLKIQEYYTQITQLQQAKEQIKKQSEIEQNKLRDELMQSQDEALMQIDKINQQFNEERIKNDREKQQLKRDNEELIAAQQKIVVSYEELQELLEQEAQKSEEVMQDYIQLEENFNKEKIDMEQTVNEVKQAYEDKLCQLEQLVQVQNDKILEMQKCYQEDPLLKMLNENPEILNTIEAIQQQQQQQEGGKKIKDTNQGQKNKKVEQNISQINGNIEQQYLDQLQLKDQYIQECKLIHQQLQLQIFNLVQDNQSIKDLEIEKFKELINNVQQLQKNELDEKQQIQGQLNQLKEELAQKNEELQENNIQLEDVARMYNDLQEQNDQLKQFLTQNLEVFQQSQDQENQGYIEEQEEGERDGDGDGDGEVIENNREMEEGGNDDDDDDQNKYDDDYNKNQRQQQQKEEDEDNQEQQEQYENGQFQNMKNKFQNFDKDQKQLNNRFQQKIIDDNEDGEEQQQTLVNQRKVAEQKPKKKQ